jgi:hypothetical protein
VASYSHAEQVVGLALQPIAVGQMPVTEGIFIIACNPFGEDVVLLE